MKSVEGLIPNSFINIRILSLVLWFILLTFIYFCFGNFIKKKIFQNFSFLFFIFLGLSLTFSSIYGFFKVDRKELNIKYERIKEFDKIQTEELKINPNVYYIILDQYPRSDILEKIYKFDKPRYIPFV